MFLRLFVLFALFFSNLGFSLSCYEVKQLAGTYFKMHFSYNEFTDELSRRTLTNFIRAWDPGKMFFLKSDVDKFEQDFGSKINEFIAKNDCKFIDTIVGVYSTRFEERQKPIDELIKAKPDFTVDEYLEFDRKKTPYAATSEELTERWRKRVKFQMLQLKETIPDLDKVREKMNKRYALSRKQHNELKKSEIYSMFLNAFAASLDPHSDYMSPDVLEDFQINTRLSLEGIGAVLRSEDGFTKIQSMVPGGAAQLSKKLKMDDKIIAVAQGPEAPVDVIDMDLRDVVKLIRGKRGTEVRLSIVRDDKGKSVQMVVPLVREKVQLTDRAAKSKVYTVNTKGAKPEDTKQIKVGVLTLPSFYLDFEGRKNKEKDIRSASVDMQREIEKMKKQKIDSMVVDLRNNGGGSLDESINVGGLFITKGPIVQTKMVDGSINVQSDKDPAIAYDGPLVVMINRQSASASEIFAGAMQDYGRGLIVGDTHTFGKGTVQNLNDISDKLGAVKITIAKFYRPSGSSTQLKGVESDIVLPDLMDELEIGEKFYDYAMPWDKIKDVDYHAVNQVAPYVPKLREASKKRVDSDEGFKQIFADIKTYKDGEKDRSRVSLKEKTKAEKEKDAKNKEKVNKKKTDAEEGAEDAELKITEDFHLQEGIKIAADYANSIKNILLASQMDIKEVEEQKNSKTIAAASKGSKKDHKKDSNAEVAPSKDSMTVPKPLINKKTP